MRQVTQSEVQKVFVIFNGSIVLTHIPCRSLCVVIKYAYATMGRPFYLGTWDSKLKPFFYFLCAYLCSI